jgi:RHS repeat-associated protein
MILVDGGYVKDGQYHFFLQDHLGSNRVVADANGNVVQASHYYPYGMPFAESYAQDVQKRKYIGKELDTENGLNLYDYDKRMQDGLQFISIDPMAEKYYSVSPYAYCAGNPVNYVDLRGDSITLADIQKLDQQLKTDFANRIINDLQAQTGLTITLNNNGVMTYAKDKDGKPVVATKTDANGKTVQTGSETARNLMVSAMDHGDMVEVKAGSERSNVEQGTNTVKLDAAQIGGFIAGTVDLDSRTLGWGMTFMHELHHTQVGGGLRDSPGNPGPVVTRMNLIRSELNVQGGKYGQRMNYPAIRIGKRAYLPFDRGGNEQIRVLGLPPFRNYIGF